MVPRNNRFLGLGSELLFSEVTANKPNGADPSSPVFSVRLVVPRLVIWAAHWGRWAADTLLRVNFCRWSKIMSYESKEKESPLIEFLKTLGIVLGVPIALFSVINSIFAQPTVSLVVAIITGVVLSVWLAYSHKINFSYLAIAWLSFAVIILLGFVIWPKTMTLEGYVNDSNGNPVSNETVMFFDYTGRTYETRTDATGFYQFVDVPTGKYRIRVRTTEIQGETKGVLVRVVQQSISVSAEAANVLTPTPTSTSTPVLANTPSPTKTPRPTPAPSATIDADPTVYDNFNNPANDGFFDLGLWLGTPGSKFEQRSGVLIVKGQEGADNTELLASRYQGIVLTNPIFLEGKLKISSERNKGNIHLQIRYPGWFAQCGIDGNMAFCGDTIWPPVEGHSWSPPNKTVQYDEWHTFRIEVEPPTMIFTYYIDGQKLGSHVPVDSEKFKNKALELPIGVIGDVTGYVDDIRIGIK